MQPLRIVFEPDFEPNIGMDELLLYGLQDGVDAVTAAIEAFGGFEQSIQVWRQFFAVRHGSSFLYARRQPGGLRGSVFNRTDGEYQVVPPCQALPPAPVPRGPRLGAAARGVSPSSEGRYRARGGLS